MFAVKLFIKSLELISYSWVCIYFVYWKLPSHFMVDELSQIGKILSEEAFWFLYNLCFTRYLMKKHLHYKSIEIEENLLNAPFRKLFLPILKQDILVLRYIIFFLGWYFWIFLICSIIFRRFSFTVFEFSILFLKKIMFR